jgi:phosphoribosylaminoimidazole-succinocarboxamide synthase
VFRPVTTSNAKSTLIYGVDSGFVSDPTTGIRGDFELDTSCQLDRFIAGFASFPAWTDSVRAGHAVSIGFVPETAVELPRLDLYSRGKVREMYDLGDRLLMVASDRISAYDVVLPTTIPDKGKVLTGLSVFWFDKTADIVPNHFVSTDVPDEVRGRALVVRKLEIFPVECVVRGYLSGSGWKEYQRDGSVCGIELPPGLRESDRLPRPIFTPATKAEIGEHDENIDFDRAAEIVGDRGLMEALRSLSLAVYERAREHAERNGIVLADTKFEFGRGPDGEIVLADEVLTPDSSRFWPRSSYAPGGSQPSFDKQYVRDWLDQSGWDHTPPGPELPNEVVQNTRAKYVEAFERITGGSFDAWLSR